MRQAMKLGAWCGLAISAYLAGLFKLGVNSDVLLNLDLPTMIIGIILTQRSVQKAAGVRLRYVMTVGFGFTFVAASGIVSRGFYFLWLRFIDDSLLQMIVDQWRLAGREVEKGTPLGFAAGSLVGWLVVGLFVSTIAGFFTRGPRAFTPRKPIGNQIRQPKGGQA